MDLLLNRYSQIEYVLSADFEVGVGLINKAMEKADEKRKWEMWLAQYPQMTKESYISFEDFHNRSSRKTSTEPQKSKTEILDDVSTIMQMMKGG
ncbi:hypothetical protein [Cohnella lupini]|uniref:Uncharacterized protein n=1 Tax=Cohnella lupini TaxID=1294267 RepID=A0A3D9HZ42_9BACL|nr:hypothetical protein [Cohnella lupini]RED54798.1 hypothetical protein DFP95_12154 [Cohnella lupini]